MLALLGTMFGSIFSGGATGLLGIVFQRYFDFKNKQQDIEVIKLNLQNAIDLKRIEIEQTAKEWEGRAHVATVEGEAKITVAQEERAGVEAQADAQTLEASYANDASTYLTATVLNSNSRLLRFAMVAVDTIRGLVRPVLTLYLVIVAHMMYINLHAMLQERGTQLTGEQIQTLAMQVIGTLLYLATTAVVWWFGTRPTKKENDK